MRKEIKYAIIIAVGITIILLGFWFAFGQFNPFYVVASGSMIPNLNIDDYVIVSHSVPFNSLKVGDIIVFKTYGTDNSGQHITIVHRVAEIVTDPINGQKVIRTKGDANPDSIPGADYPIFQPLYIGLCHTKAGSNYRHSSSTDKLYFDRTHLYSSNLLS